MTVLVRHHLSFEIVEKTGEASTLTYLNRHVSKQEVGDAYIERTEKQFQYTSSKTSQASQYLTPPSLEGSSIPRN